MTSLGILSIHSTLDLPASGISDKMATSLRREFQLEDHNAMILTHKEATNDMLCSWSIAEWHRRKLKLYLYWLIWQSCQWAYTIMNCPSCVVIGIVVVIIVVICGQSSCPQVWSQKLHILHIYAHMPLVYAHELVSEYNMYFLNGSHFSSILHVDLLTTWFNLEPSYLAQLCTCTGAIHTQKIMQLWTIFLK